MVFWTLDVFVGVIWIADCCSVSFVLCRVSHCFSVVFLLLGTEGAIAGATAGVVVETALYPIDTIKTRLQVNESPCC